MATLDNSSNSSSQRHSHAPLIYAPSSAESQPVTLPRKRRPRAVGEVGVTCPASIIYLNATPEPNPVQPPEAEPIYQNETAVELSQQRAEQQRLQRRQRRQHLSVLRICHEEPLKEGEAAARASMVVSTFVGSLQFDWGRSRGGRSYQFNCFIHFLLYLSFSLRRLGSLL